MLEILSNLWAGAQYALTFSNILGALLGYGIGVVCGSIPGLMGVTGMAIILPFTFTMSPLFAIAAMMGCYKGGCYAGSITAALFNIPGTPEAAATVLDAYPMTLRGQQKRALELALWASVIGGTISNFLLIFTAPPLAQVALSVGPAETAALVLFSLTAVIGLLGTSRLAIWKGFISVILGLMLASVGLDPILSTRRYVFNITELDSGIPFVVAVIAMLAFTEILEQVNKERLDVDKEGAKLDPMREVQPYGWRERLQDLRFCWKDLLRSSLLGSFFGALPGIGAAPAAFVCYGEARRAAKDKENFGKGDPRGIVAPESGNNAVAAASLIPLVTLGIPGSVAAAVLGGAFMVQGMIPGPMLMHDYPQVIYGLFVLFVVTDILGAFVVALPFVALVRKLFSLMNYNILFPLVIVFCGIGVYIEHFNVFSIRLLVILGGMSFVLEKLGFNVSAMVLAFILGPIFERETRTALVMSGGDFSIFLKSPVACTLLVLSVLLFFWSLWQKIKSERGENSSLLQERER